MTAANRYYGGYELRVDPTPPSDEAGLSPAYLTAYVRL